MKRNFLREDDITNELVGDYQEFELKRPEKNKEYKEFKYDLCVKCNGEVVALIEAKYRSKPYKPTTDSLISSFMKLHREWVHSFGASPSIKIIFLIYIKDEENLKEITPEMRKNLFKRLKGLLFYYSEPEIINLRIKIKNGEIKNLKEIKEHLKNELKTKLNGKIKHLKLNWIGALSELKKEFKSSVDLQHAILKWWAESAF